MYITSFREEKKKIKKSLVGGEPHMITMYIKAKYSNSQSFYLWFILNSCLTDYIESQVLIVTKKYHPQYGYILV